MKRTSVLSGALAMIAVAVVGSAAQASSLPAASGFVQCATNTGNITSAGSCNGGADSGSVTYSPFAGVQGNALGQFRVDQAGLFGVLNYSLEVTGGNPGDVVPIDIATLLTAIPVSGGYVFSEIIVSADNSAAVTICSSGCGVDTGVTSFAGTLQVDAVSGVVYSNAIHLEIEASGGYNNTLDGGMASADPHIYVDPGFANAAGYSVVLSPGIGNGLPTVPVPSSLWLLAIGLVVLACLHQFGHSAAASRSRTGPPPPASRSFAAA